MSHCGAPTFDNHFDYRLMVFKDIQHGTSNRMHCVGWNVVNVSWNDFGELDGVVHVWLGSLQRVSPEVYGMKYFNHQIPKSESGKYSPCVNLHQEKLFPLLLSCARPNWHERLTSEYEKNSS